LGSECESAMSHVIANLKIIAYDARFCYSAVAKQYCSYSSIEGRH